MKINTGIFFLLIAFISTSCDSISSNETNENQLVENKEERADRYLIEENGRFGYINHLGEVVVNPQFEEASSFSEGLAKVRYGKKWGFINVEGKLVINPQFDDVGSFSEGLADVKIGKKRGYIDKEGKFIVAPQFDFTHSFSDGLARVEIGLESLSLKCGFIDKEGKFAINPQFDYAHDFSEGLAEVEIDGKWGFINRDGKYIANPQFDWVSSFFEEMAAVEIDEKWGFINKEGKYVINPQFDDVYSFSDGLAEVLIDGKWGFVNKDGMYSINPQFNHVSSFINGIAPIELNGKWGFIDKGGKYIIKPQFEDVSDFNENDGLAMAKIDGKWGFIDKEGKYIINPQFDDADWFDADGLAIVKIVGKWGCIDRDGRYIINPSFDSICAFSGGLARAENEGWWGYINKEGKWIWQSQRQDNDNKLLDNQTIGKENKSQTQITQKASSQSTIEQDVQWPTYSIPNVCSVMVPLTMELRDDNSSAGKLFSVINPSLYKLLCDGCDVFSDHSKIVFQPEGMNSDNPKDIDRATATYARIIIEFGYNHDVSQEDVKSMTTADLVEYNDIIYKQYKSEFDYAQQALGKTGTLVWHPMKREKIGGKYCIVLDYDRPGLQGMVKVKKYAFYYNGKEVDITCSYRISEKQKYEKDFEKAVRSLVLD